MFLNKLVSSINSRLVNNLILNYARAYTVIVERHEIPGAMKEGIDQRKRHLKSNHFHYKFVDCLHNKKWGNVDLILTQYVEGVGHKGEIVNVPRHQAYYDLLPSRLAVFPTDEYLKLYEKDRELLADKAKVSPFAMKTKEELSKMLLEIPMNMQTEWTLKTDNIRIALRYNKVMCPNENIVIPENIEITNKNYEMLKDNFVVKIKVNDYVTADLKCKIVPLNVNKLWEEFTIFHKTV